MATFEKRGDYQWRAKVRRLGHKQVSKTFDTKTDAENWAREIERKMKRGEIDDPNPTTQKNTIYEAVDSYSDLVLPTLACNGDGGQIVHLRRIVQAFGPLYVAVCAHPQSTLGHVI